MFFVGLQFEKKLRKVVETTKVNVFLESKNHFFLKFGFKKLYHYNLNEKKSKRIQVNLSSIIEKDVGIYCDEFLGDDFHSKLEHFENHLKTEKPEQEEDTFFRKTIFSVCYLRKS